MLTVVALVDDHVNVLDWPAAMVRGAALKDTAIDPASFTSIRLASGAVALWLIVRLRDGGHGLSGSWPSAFALFTYAAAFSYAYVSLTAATGALLQPIFGEVLLAKIAGAAKAPLMQAAGLFASFNRNAATMFHQLLEKKESGEPAPAEGESTATLPAEEPADTDTAASAEEE